MDILVCFAECNIMYVALLASLNNPDERKKGRKYLLIRIFTQIHISLDIMTKMEFKKLCEKFSRILNTIKSIISTLDILYIFARAMHSMHFYISKSLTNPHKNPQSTYN